ncbi:uncharacterized protein BJ171DRAFT_485685 [Polychytrium aggregatum]|uniref:uncharacterized protein n=1 Tax=Polychytrium aggregatum TaxID=110093 RepID=UPI0022FF3806|nr:uncharacterized protein BJ171DRAFT_485685 [Polychytrium aggregatum]KAI9209183.1 hypothetical protein BJ171DRAFT_485685 [Polychytrium aggregatum]
MPASLAISPYWAAVHGFSFVMDIFFRDIQQRNAHSIPTDGPVIFVIAPHANQFIDPLVVLKHCGRETGFLAAKKSMDKFWIGLFARTVSSIPVERPQDLAKAGKGKIFMRNSGEQPLKLYGIGTEFTKQVGPRGAILLNSSLGSDMVEVVSIESDTELTLKKTFDIKSESQADATLFSEITGATYKVVPHVDQSVMFKTVTERLKAGGCVGIFPEGGSHDRSEFLPLKAGVTIMALGAMAEHPGLEVKIVPVGLNYFHPDRFRSRAVVEFGDPITVDHKLVEDYKKGGADKRNACSKLLDDIYKALKAVTVTAPDYDTLMAIQAARRLYIPHSKKITSAERLDISRRFAAAYQAFHGEPEVQSLYQRIKEYNQRLGYYGIRDHQVKNTGLGYKAAVVLASRLIQVVSMALFALPGALLCLPIGIIAQKISAEKAKEAKAGSNVKIWGRDVIGTWKVLVSAVLFPIAFSFYTLVTIIVMYWKHGFGLAGLLLTAIFTPMILFLFTAVAIRTGEVGLDIVMSLKPLVLAVIDPKSMEPLRTMRTELQQQLISVADKFGPSIIEGYATGEGRIIKPEDFAAKATDGTIKGKLLFGGALIDGTTQLIGGTTQLIGDTTQLIGSLQSEVQKRFQRVEVQTFRWEEVSEGEEDEVFFFHKDDVQALRDDKKNA